MAEAKAEVMTQKPTRIPESTADELPRELIDLGKKIAALPEEHYRELEHSYSQIVDCVRRRRRILNLVQEALSQLRLDVKYLMFDLEITRQERDLLQAQIEDGGRDDFTSDWS
ncbi:transcriptional regulator [Thalassoglobus sp.]|uniref:transcriptional regulator n=1 Tax=Thalassoglobus sp. TaxID=2795869 RepID=UPI003AA8F206